MPYADEDLILISALQHHLFCPRQCALIHVDGLWAENRLTTEGNLLHERSDAPGYRTRGDRGKSPVRVVRALPLVNRWLGVTGKADQVEFRLDQDGIGQGPPVPIEHKRGRPKRLDHDRVQVAAQAMCLEEMLGVEVPRGELFYHAARRREVVILDAGLRSLVERVANEVRENIAQNRVPIVVKQAKCRTCSLVNLCMPGGTEPGRAPERYVSRALARSLSAAAIGGTSA